MHVFSDDPSGFLHPWQVLSSVWSSIFFSGSFSGSGGGGGSSSFGHFRPSGSCVHGSHQRLPPLSKNLPVMGSLQLAHWHVSQQRFPSLHLPPSSGFKTLLQVTHRFPASRQGRQILSSPTVANSPLIGFSQAVHVAPPAPAPAESVSTPSSSAHVLHSRLPSFSNHLPLIGPSHLRQRQPSHTRRFPSFSQVRRPTSVLPSGGPS